MSGKRRIGPQTFVCYSDGCPDHEPPDVDCAECAKAFWDPRLSALAGQGEPSQSAGPAAPNRET